MSVRLMKHLFMGMRLDAILSLSAGPAAADSNQLIAVRNLLKLLYCEQSIVPFELLEANAF